LKALLAANKRLNIAYLLKESFGQLWSYEREGWARRFFDNWRDRNLVDANRPRRRRASTLELPVASGALYLV
jgi:hypothetical protein